VEAALARKQRMAELADDQIPNLEALGRQIVEQAKQLTPEEQERIKRFAEAGRVVLEDPGAGS
jgi:hypothetical protein